MYHFSLKKTSQILCNGDNITPQFIVFFVYEVAWNYCKRTSVWFFEWKHHFFFFFFMSITFLWALRQTIENLTNQFCFLFETLTLLIFNFRSILRIFSFLLFKFLLLIIQILSLKFINFFWTNRFIDIKRIRNSQTRVLHWRILFRRNNDSRDERFRLGLG